jgi:hypothetical protein
MRGLPSGIRQLFSKHFGNEEDNYGSKKSSSAKKINQRIAGCGKHVG